MQSQFDTTFFFVLQKSLYEHQREEHSNSVQNSSRQTSDSYCTCTSRPNSNHVPPFSLTNHSLKTIGCVRAVSLQTWNKTRQPVCACSIVKVCENDRYEDSVMYSQRVYISASIYLQADVCRSAMHSNTNVGRVHNFRAMHGWSIYRSMYTGNFTLPHRKS